MQNSQLPAKISTPFASGAGASYVRTVPVASQQGVGNGAAASYTDGFPPVCFLPTTSGGVPPAGQDFNGVLNQVTAWTRWQAAGGTVPFDQAFATAIGGYPYGAIVQSTTTGRLWLCTADGNATNPDSSGAANWVAISTAGTSVGTLINVQVWDVTTGSGTYVPTSGASSADWELTAGGAGGAGAYNGAAGGGGGAGETRSGFLTSLSQQTVTIGAGGTGGTGISNGSTTNGTAGGNSVFGSIATAIGGQPTTTFPGTSYYGGVGGNGGFGGSGGRSIPGGSGTSVTASTGSGTPNISGGSGGASRYGGGGSGSSQGTNVNAPNGQAGQAPGSGGGGGSSGTTTGAIGGAGAAGRFIIREYR